MKNVAVAVVLAFALLSGASAQDLRYVGTFSNLGLYQNFEQEFWSETVPSLLPGVTTDVTTFDQMGLGGEEVFRLLDLGLYDIGATVADYVVTDAPVLEGLDLPGLALDIETAREIASAYKPVLDDAMQEVFNAKLLSVVPYPAQVFFCNTPVTSLEDLQGKRVRASGRSTSDFVEAIGASGVTLAFGEVPQALQQGVVECAITGSTSGYSAGWDEVSTHLYTLPAGGWDYVITAMSLESWNELSEEQQQTLLTAIEEQYEAPVWEGIGEETQQGINCLTNTGECTLGEPGDMTLVEVADEDLEQIREVLENEVLPAWAARVDPETVERWNETVGDVAGVSMGAQ